MSKLDFADMPEAFARHSIMIERLVWSESVRTVPAIVGWANHAGVREAHHPLNTCVCSSSYDHINLDVTAQRVRDLYRDYPQTRTLVTPAGLPGMLTPMDAYARMTEWGGDWGLRAGVVPELKGPEIYMAAPIFVMHRPDEGRDPLALVACRFTVSEPMPRYIYVDIDLQQVAVSPEHRNRGLAHLAVLEASRWLGMLARTTRFNDAHEWRVAQRVHARPTTSHGLQLARAFYGNYCFFGITDELINNAARERRSSQIPRGSLRSALGAIRDGAGFEEMIHSHPGLERTARTHDLELEAELK